MLPRFLSISLGCFALGAFIAQGASAQTCGTGTCTGEQFCWVSDGYLYDPGPFFCPLIFDGFLIDATLDNYGEFSAGDYVRVEGCFGFVISLCDVTSAHFFHNTIESALPEPEVPALGFSGRAVAVILMAGLALWFGKRFR